MRRFLAAGGAFVVLAAHAAAAFAQGLPELAQCRAIVDANERLRCYDALARGDAPVVDPAAGPTAAAPLAREDPRSAWLPSGTDGPGRSLLSQRWELDREDKYGTFKFTYYRPNYILPVLWSQSANRAPVSPTRGPVDVDIPYRNVEASFQLSFKMKLVEELLGTPSDVWVGYTQQSHWQVYSGGLSRPFRETDFEPEVMWVAPLDVRLLGLRWRLAGLGLAHQSNGRAEPLSRSWNRAYAMVGAERDRFVAQLRVWKRIREPAGDDDNPDLADHIGRAELLTYYRWAGGTSGALRLRSTLGGRPGWGSAQVDWRFPFTRNLLGYVQAFSGYGESLIDYNFRKTAIGIGISVGTWY